MDKAEELRQWFDIARKDLESEKYLKGFLFLHNIEPPKIHDLAKLRKMCEQINASFNTLQFKCVFLTQYGIMPRYPNELQINPDDVRTAIQYAKDIKILVETVVNNATKAEDTP